MTEVKVQYAKTHLSALLAQVEAGEEIVIKRGDVAVARLVPMTKPQRRLGFMSGPVPPDSSFFDPLPDDELAAWEGAHGDPSVWEPGEPTATA